jgi:hypothetical protein
MKFSYLNFQKLVLRGKHPLELMFLKLSPIRRFLILPVWIHVHESVNPGGIPLFQWIPYPKTSNFRRNSIHPVDFHVKDLLIPGGIPFLRWISRPGPGDSQRNSLFLLYIVYKCTVSVRRKLTFLWLPAHSLC